MTIISRGKGSQVEELVVRLFRKLLGAVVEVVNQGKGFLLSVGGLQVLPDLLGLRFGQGAVQDVAAYQYDALAEEQFVEEGEDQVGRGVGSIAFEIF
jgi:hypothetical protein